MIYNFNLGVGWASSGVEYAQAYRASIFRNLGAEARFIFTDMFPQENIEHMTANLGFRDEEVIWLYTFFTNCRTAPVSYTLKMLEQEFSDRQYTAERKGSQVRYIMTGTDMYYNAYLTGANTNLVHRVEIVSGGCLIRKDYYTYCRIYSEYYAPLDKKAHLYHRRFFNEDGSVAYEEILDGDSVMYQFPDRLICSKEELVGYLVERLKPGKKDVLIIDRATMIGQPILEHAGEARVFSVIHADHFSEGSTDDTNILWNNYYEYLFSQNRHVDTFITATEAQKKLLTEQFEQYLHVSPQIAAIPVGSIRELKKPSAPRKKHSLITASRLAGEKHVDWLIDAVNAASQEIPDLTLDIYGKGGEEARLQQKIRELGCEDRIRLCGQQDLREIYVKYEAYLSGSTSEGFGLSLLEAIGSGLPIIGFDVRYGNPTFIDDEQNGYLIPSDNRMERRDRVSVLKDRILRLFTEADLDSFHAHSYEKAEQFLEREVEQKWKQLLEKTK